MTEEAKKLSSEDFEQSKTQEDNVVHLPPNSADSIVQKVVMAWLAANINEFDARRNRYKKGARWIKEPALIVEIDAVCAIHQSKHDIRYQAIQIALAAYKAANIEQENYEKDRPFYIPVWVMSQVSALHAEFTEFGEVRFTDGSNGGLKEMINLVFEEAFTQQAANIIKERITKDQIATVLTNESHRIRHKYTQKVAEDIKHDPTLADHMGAERAIEILTGISCPDTALDVAVLKHFCWQVKRKMVGLPVTRHLFAVFTGGQNAGKTTFLKLFFKPLGRFVLDLSIQAVCDDRNYPEFQNHFIGFCDEMSKADKAEANELKKVITTEYLACHLMHTNSMGKPKQNLTFIGAANPALQDIIKDDTGMRRFHEILVVDKEELMPFWDEINRMDYLAIWKSVDENGPSPLMPVLPELTKRQEQLRAKGLVEKFIEDEELQPGDDADDSLFVSTEELYQCFVSWCKEQNIRIIPDKQDFSRKMAGFDFKPDRVRVDGKRPRGFWVKKGNINDGLVNEGLDRDETL